MIFKPYIYNSGHPLPTHNITNFYCGFVHSVCISITMAGNNESTGRKKIEIKKIEKPSRRIVTFSKRRKGLFTKAAELSRMCGAEVAVIVFSPKDRLYTFSHPSANSVIDRFLAQENSSSSSTPSESQCIKVDQSGLVDKPIENMELEELQRYMAAMVEFKKEAKKRANEMDMRRMATRELVPLHPVVGDGYAEDG